MPVGCLPVVSLQGHLTEDALRSLLARIEPALLAEPCGLVIDSTQMTGYDDAARSLFVKWNAHNRSRIARVAIVTDKVLWRVVISAMGLASRQEMRPFTSLVEAQRWASTATAAGATTGRVLLKTTHFLVIEESEQLIRLSRTGESVGVGDDAVSRWMEVSEVLDRAGRKGRSLLCDLRLAPSRNDPEFERTMRQVVPKIHQGFARNAVVVRMAAGALQVRRHARQDGIERLITDSEEQALSYLLDRAPEFQQGTQRGSGQGRMQLQIPPDNAVQIGSHCLWIEDDVYVTVLDGDITVEHVAAMQRVSQPLLDKHGYMLSLVDARRAGTITPDARRISAAHQREHPSLGAVAAFGTGVLLRAMYTAYSQAVSLVTASPRELALFKTESEARAWLDSQRIRLRRLITRPRAS